MYIQTRSRCVSFKLELAEFVFLPNLNVKTQKLNSISKKVDLILNLHYSKLDKNFLSLSSTYKNCLNSE